MSVQPNKYTIFSLRNYDLGSDEKYTLQLNLPVFLGIRYVRDIEMQNHTAAGLTGIHVGLRRRLPLDGDCAGQVVDADLAVGVECAPRHLPARPRLARNQLRVRGANLKTR